jgi:CcmD family protein
MRRVRSVWRVLLLWLLLAAGPVWSLTVAAQQPRAQPPKAAQDEFVPIDQLPPGEQLPAAPLLIAAYSVAWLAVAGYLFSIWRRLDRVDRDITEAGRRLPRT